MTTFAIVIPNLNQSHFLPWALESLRYQTEPLNLALMDGGSKDNFKEVVRQYSDIIAYLNSGPDGGQAAAIREGKRKVYGDVVAWLNADDYYFPDTLRKVSAAFEEDPSVDVVYGDAVHVTPQGSFLSYFPPIQTYDARMLTKRCFICQPACFVRRSAYEEVGGIDPSLRYTMDWDLWCRLSLSGAGFRYIQKPLAAVRYYDSTKTLSSDRLRYSEIYRIERKYGHRLLPLSWPGFYRFDLSFKKKRTCFEDLSLDVLDIVKKIKRLGLSRRLYHNQMLMPLYGFDRFETSLVYGQCTIHLPWYAKEQLGRLYLRICPSDRRYRVVVNGMTAMCEKLEKNWCCVRFPSLNRTYVKISIEQQRKKSIWRLKDFMFDLESL